MGITSFSVQLIEKYGIEAKTVCELGAQQMYNQPVLPAPYAKEWYEKMGIDYTCIDISGENEAVKLDLSFYDLPYYLSIKFSQGFDLVTDFGTSEHVGKDGKFDMEAIYNCWHTKHQLLKEGGIMINENPKTGNWPGHGFNYYTIDFYLDLKQHMDYEILELGEHPAMGNTTDGWNVYCVLRKKNSDEFMSLEEFSTLGILQS